MSQENVEIMRSDAGAFNRGDSPGKLGILDENVEWHGTSGGLRTGTSRVACEAVRRNLEIGDEDWEETQARAQEFIDVGDRSVLLQHELRRGRGSGVEWSPRPRSSSTSVTDV